MSQINCVFESTYGYSSLVRSGKIYKIQKSHYIFMLTSNIDLLDYRIRMKRFIHICKNKMKDKLLLFFLTINDLTNRERGMTSIPRLRDKYYRTYFK